MYRFVGNDFNCHIVNDIRIAHLNADNIAKNDIQLIIDDIGMLVYEQGVDLLSINELGMFLNTGITNEFIKRVLDLKLRIIVNSCEYVEGADSAGKGIALIYSQRFMISYDYKLHPTGRALWIELRLNLDNSVNDSISLDSSRRFNVFKVFVIYSISGATFKVSDQTYLKILEIFEWTTEIITKSRDKNQCCIVAGDMNSVINCSLDYITNSDSGQFITTRHSIAKLFLEFGGIDCFRYCHPNLKAYTFKSETNCSRLDYIFVWPNEAFAPVRAAICYNEIFNTKHRLVITDLHAHHNNLSECYIIPSENVLAWRKIEKYFKHTPMLYSHAFTLETWCDDILYFDYYNSMLDKINCRGAYAVKSMEEVAIFISAGMQKFKRRIKHTTIRNYSSQKNCISSVYAQRLYRYITAYLNHRLDKTRIKDLITDVIYCALSLSEWLENNSDIFKEFTFKYGEYDPLMESIDHIKYEIKKENCMDFFVEIKSVILNLKKFIDYVQNRRFKQIVTDYNTNRNDAAQRGDYKTYFSMLGKNINLPAAYIPTTAKCKDDKVIPIVHRNQIAEGTINEHAHVLESKWPGKIHEDFRPNIMTITYDEFNFPIVNINNKPITELDKKSS